MEIVVATYASTYVRDVVLGLPTNATPGTSSCGLLVLSQEDLPVLTADIWSVVSTKGWRKFQLYMLLKH